MTRARASRSRRLPDSIRWSLNKKLIKFKAFEYNNRRGLRLPSGESPRRNPCGLNGTRQIIKYHQLVSSRLAAMQSRLFRNSSYTFSRTAIPASNVGRRVKETSSSRDPSLFALPRTKAFESADLHACVRYSNYNLLCGSYRIQEP